MIRSQDVLATSQNGEPLQLTPEPEGGFNVDGGVEDFVRRYGYIDRVGRPDRMNFGGKYVSGIPCHLTGLMLKIEGFNARTGKMRGDGRIMLVKEGETDPAAVWPFGELLRHWSRKHAKAAYVPSMSQRLPKLSYKFAGVVRLGEGTDYIRFLRAVTDGSVFYDPGIKLEHLSGRAVVKRRSQFRIASGDLPRLYDSMHVETVSWNRFSKLFLNHSCCSLTALRTSAIRRPSLSSIPRPRLSYASLMASLSCVSAC